PAAPPHLDVLETVQAPQQFGIDQRLDEAVSLRPPELRVRRSHLGEQPAFGVEEPQDLVRDCVRQDRLHEPDRLECAQRLVVESDPAGVVDQRVAFVCHQGPNTLQAKDVREREPHRAGADDDDLEIGHARPSRKSMCNRLNVLASSYCGQCPHPSITSNRAPGIIDAIRRPSVTSAVGSSLVHSTSVGAMIAPYSSGPRRLRARICGSCNAMMSRIAATNPGWRYTRCRLATRSS